MDKFSWVDCDDRKGQTLSFLKYGTEEKDTLLVACNFSNKLGIEVGAALTQENGM